MTKIRWGIIGCGAVTEIKSGPAFYNVKGSELVAVMRRNINLAEDYALRHGVKYFFDDADQLINSREVDAVYIATPPASHKVFALKVANAGKPCCVEKPMALDYQECIEMVDAFNRNNLPLFVAYYRRSLPRFKQIKEWLEDKKIGEARQLHWSFSKPPNIYDIEEKENWRTNPKIAGGGYFIDLASHGIDLFQYLLGDITLAQGIKLNQQGLYEAEDAVAACWQFGDNILGSGYWNFAAQKREDSVEIIGSEGKIIFSVFTDKALVMDNGESVETKTIDNPETIQIHHVENMIKHLQGKAAHPSQGESAAKTNWVMDAILGEALI